jgi:hypothetical protein
MTASDINSLSNESDNIRAALLLVAAALVTAGVINLVLN